MKPGNFEDLIHDQDYRAPYEAQQIRADTLITTPVPEVGQGARQRHSLNGWWSFSIDMYDTFLRAKWYEQHGKDQHPELPRDFDFASWEQVYVPSCWNTLNERYLYYEGSAVYTRCFDRPTSAADTENRSFLRFGAVQYDAKVFLNGTYLGMHRGGSTPFCMEITQHLRPKNRLIVSVNNRRESWHVPMENTDWFNYGGIYRDVDILTVPESYLQHATCQLVPDGSFRRLRFWVQTDGDPRNDVVHVSIPELDIRSRIDVAQHTGELELGAEPELWSPDNPRLYDVFFEYGEDRVQERIGFREIRVEGNDVFLNGKPTFFAGISCHEESITDGKALSESDRAQDLDNAFDLGCRYMRLAHYPHSERTAVLSDERGMLLWEEIPVYWAIDFENAVTYADAENQLTELILRDQNRASVVIWSVGNENPDTDSRLRFMRSLVERARDLDASRLVSAACLVEHSRNRISDRLAEHLDIIGLNEYYGWYKPGFDLLIDLLENSAPDRPVFITEFGAGAKSGHHGATGELFTEECQAAVYREQIKSFRKTSYLKGISPWILYDFRSPRRLNGLQRGYNLKGLVDSDRTHRKRAFGVLRDYYESLQAPE
jgi:beta-glucuronidase